VQPLAITSRAWGLASIAKHHVALLPGAADLLFSRRLQEKRRPVAGSPRLVFFRDTERPF